MSTHADTHTHTHADTQVIGTHKRRAHTRAHTEATSLHAQCRDDTHFLQSSVKGNRSQSRCASSCMRKATGMCFVVYVFARARVCVYVYLCVCVCACVCVCVCVCVYLFVEPSPRALPRSPRVNSQGVEDHCYARQAAERGFVLGTVSRQAHKTQHTYTQGSTRFDPDMHLAVQQLHACAHNRTRVRARTHTHTHTTYLNCSMSLKKPFVCPAARASANSCFPADDRQGTNRGSEVLPPACRVQS